MQLYVFIYFFVILFFVIHHKICVFNIFISFFDKVSKFCNRLLHCLKIVRIRSYSGPHFSHIFPHSDWMRRDGYFWGKKAIIVAKMEIKTFNILVKMAVHCIFWSPNFEYFLIMKMKFLSQVINYFQGI